MKWKNLVVQLCKACALLLCSNHLQKIFQNLVYFWKSKKTYFPKRDGENGH